DCGNDSAVPATWAVNAPALANKIAAGPVMNDGGNGAKASLAVVLVLSAERPCAQPERRTHSGKQQKNNHMATEPATFLARPADVRQILRVAFRLAIPQILKSSLRLAVTSRPGQLRWPELLPENPVWCVARI